MDEPPVMHTRYRVSPQTQSITDHFYTWDYRLRGYDLYEYPIHPEPVFVPFFSASTPREPIVDDARHHTLISGFIASLTGTRQPREEPAPVEEGAETAVAPSLYVPEGERVEFQIALAKDVEYSPTQIISFLQGLRGLRHPVTFELIGTTTHILVQFSVLDEDRVFFESQFAAFFPQAVVATQQQSLVQAWMGTRGEHRFIVDFGLADECGLSLRAFERTYAPDPFISLIAALETVAERECAVLQVIFAPVRHNWQAELVTAITDYDGTCIFADAPALKRATEQKVGSHLYATVIRAGSISHSPENAKTLVQRIGSALGQCEVPGGNRLIPLENDYYPVTVHEDDLLLRLTHRPGMLLSAPELVGLVHLPSSQVVSAKLLRNEGKTKACPLSVVGNELVLGSNVHHGSTRTVSLSVEQRLRHLYLIGASGTGKSTLLLNLIAQDMEHGEGFALLDPHGDLTDDVLRRVPEHRKNDVIILDPGDADYPVGFNIFHAHSEAEKTLLASDLVRTFQRFSTSWGDRMHAILANGIMAMLEHPDGGTLLTLRRFLTDKAFRQSYLRKISDPEVRYYWEKEYPLHSGKPEASVLTRIDTFLRTKTIRNMVAQTKSTVDFSQAMAERKILLVKLTHGAIGEENSHLLGALIVTAIHQAALRRQSQDRAERTPFYLYADEFQNFVTPSMEAILSGSRKYALGLILAHQEQRQLLSKDREVASSVLTNPYTRICFRLGHNDARSLASDLSFFDAHDLQNLGIGQAIVRTEQAKYDFNLAVDWGQGADEVTDLTDELIELSRQKYGQSRVAVETLVNGFYGEYETTPQSSVEKPAPTKESYPPPPPKPVLQPHTDKPPVQPKSSGRGGTQHSYLQNLIKKYAEEHGYHASIEEEILGGKGFVDISLTLGETKIACEISVSTAIAYEVQNVQKCLAAGFDYVAVVCGSRSKLGKLQAAVQDSLEANLMDKVKILEPESFLGFLEKLTEEQASEAKTVRGYRVKSTVVRSDQHTASAKAKAVAKLIAKQFLAN